ncbi:MAG: tRNA (guanosine(46)-N7)-methyltransferase TrmB [Alphaproteobacteria bacterium]|nr:tRNA (guanosine(46)-N7)-methyltransferase TrmB [Alphaproteobacteria bacterium]
MEERAAAGIRRQLWGRRLGHRLRPSQQTLLASELPQFSIPAPTIGAIDLGLAFKRRPTEVWLEVGFGAGEHLAELARRHADIGFVGCEPFINGVASLLAKIQGEALDNIRVFVDDARLLIDALPLASLGRIFVLFPDPWPKRRHHKRRFVSPATVVAMAAALRPGGELRIATDHPGVCRWMLQHVLDCCEFAWTARAPVDWREPPPEWVPTRYEKKALAKGDRIHYLRFVRK